MKATPWEVLDEMYIVLEWYTRYMYRHCPCKVHVAIPQGCCE